MPRRSLRNKTDITTPSSPSSDHHDPVPNPENPEQPSLASPPTGPPSTSPLPPDTSGAPLPTPVTPATATDSAAKAKVASSTIAAKSTLAVAPSPPSLDAKGTESPLTNPSSTNPTAKPSITTRAQSSTATESEKSGAVHVKTASSASDKTSTPFTSHILSLNRSGSNTLAKKVPAKTPSAGSPGDKPTDGASSTKTPSVASSLHTATNKPTVRGSGAKTPSAPASVASPSHTSTGKPSAAAKNTSVSKSSAGASANKPTTRSSSAKTTSAAPSVPSPSHASITKTPTEPTRPKPQSQTTANPLKTVSGSKPSSTPLPVTVLSSTPATSPAPDEDIDVVEVTPQQRSDMEVVEVPVQQTTETFPLIEMPPFAISDYDFINGFVDLDKVQIPDMSSREVNEEHVANLKNLFETKSFNPVIGAFVVAQRQNGAPTQLDKNKMLIGGCVLVDGRHRLNAVKQLYESDVDKWSHLWQRAPMACVERKDGEEITTLEMLALAAYFNDLSSAVLKVSFLDHVHAAIQTVKIISYFTRKAPGSVSISDITKELKDRRTLGNIDERQLRRYAAVAKKLATGDDYYKAVKSHLASCPGIGLVHLNSPVLLAVRDMDLWQLAMSSLRSLLLNGVKGSFETMHASFYGCVTQLFDVVQKTATYKNMTLAGLLDAELSITAHDPKPVFNYIADTMSRYALVENQDASDKTRVRNLKKKLIQLLGEDIEPPEPQDKPKSATKKPATKANNNGPKEGVAGESTGPRRSTRKRKTVVQDSDDDDVVEKDESRPPKKKRKGQKKTDKAQSVSLSENSVSTFLRALPTDRLTRLMRKLGVKVVTKDPAPAVGRQRSTGDSALDSAVPLEVLPGFYDSFDDNLPGTLPEVWADPPPYEGPPNPSWVRFLTKIPSKWPENDIPIAHVTPWLEAMHVPHEHRAHSVITNRHILRRNHHAVYYRAAHSYHKQRPISELPDIKHRFPNVITAHEKLWCSAVVEDDAAMEFFGEKKEQLSTAGFCILESFLNDAQMPNRVGKFAFPGFSSPHQFFKSVYEEARSSFPGEESLANPDARTTWNIMQNVSSAVDSSAVIQGQGRFRMTNYGIFQRLEEDSDKVWTITARALIDVRVSQCLAALKLTQKIGSTRIFMPRTGGRWVITSAGCQRQVLHTDFHPLSRHETLSEDMSPGYFTIATGEREVPIWVCSHSHRMAATSSVAKMRAASSASTTHLIRIPPFSIFVGRGDLYYSAPATADGIGNERSLYYHTFFLREGGDIPRVLSRNRHFTPRFAANIDDDSEDDAEDMSGTSSGFTGSVKQPRQSSESDDEYHTDDMAGSDENDDASNDGDVDFSQYL